MPLAAGEDSRGIERLKWRSRRGLLELDLVFTRFWANAGGEMTREEAAALARLLELPDNDLLDLVMARKECPDAALRDLVEKLRAV
jgi:antitoxin CptB